MKSIGVAVFTVLTPDLLDADPVRDRAGYTAHTAASRFAERMA
jgi:hypothetical protein